MSGRPKKNPGEKSKKVSGKNAAYLGDMRLDPVEIPRKHATVDTDLNILEHRFCQEFVITANPPKSVFLAGILDGPAPNEQPADYKRVCHKARKIAEKMLKQPHIQKKLGELLAERDAGKVWDAQTVVTKLQGNIEAAESKGRHDIAIRGLEVLDRHKSLGLFREKIEVEVVDPHAEMRAGWERVKNAGSGDGNTESEASAS